MRYHLRFNFLLWSFERRRSLPPTNSIIQMKRQTLLMSLRCSRLCWAAAFGICLLIFATEPHGACGFSPGLLGRKSITVSTETQTLGQGEGICASAITIHGYKCEELYVTTEDGYIINMQRISEGRNGPTGKRQPVIVQHGVMCDAMSWLVNSPEQNLPTVLADFGFDVWLPNTRGTRYSRRHTTLNPRNKDYWDWSWDELAAYELPAIFDHVYEQTGQKAHYIGHSLGTLTGLICCSQRLPSVEKLQSVALLSPIAYLSHVTTKLGNLAIHSMLGETMELLGIAEFKPGGKEVMKFVNSLCSKGKINCFDVMTDVTGQNCCLNSSTVEMFMRDYPLSSSSTNNMFHLVQTARSDVLTKFDYMSPMKNLKHYGSVRPPTYRLSNFPRDLPLFIGYGGRDALSDVIDVKRLIDDDLKFHDEDKLSVLFIPDYAHEDFPMAVNAKETVYDSIVSFFKSHQQP